MLEMVIAGSEVVEGHNIIYIDLIYDCNYQAYDQ